MDMQIQAIRRDGRWVFQVRAPQWLLDDIERDLEATKPLLEVCPLLGGDTLMGAALLGPVPSKSTLRNPPEPPRPPSNPGWTSGFGKG